MKTIRLKKSLLIAFGLAFFIAGAANAEQQAGEQAPNKTLTTAQLIGQWREVGGLETLYFAKNHEAAISFGPEACFSLTGKYMIADDQKIGIDLAGAIGFFINRLVLTIALEDGFLYLTDINSENKNKEIEINVNKKRLPAKYEKTAEHP